ncbi:MAG: aldo/keto reductase [Phycisphaerales bacterium]|nr:aldo/keto reductase [Phycisphaerales bacterium]
MSLTNYITLGNSGLRVSPMCLGTMTFGNEWGVVGTNIEESNDVLAAYLDRGGNFLDTANIYTKGHSEKIIGDYFASNQSRRDRTVIATKFCGNMYPGDPNGGGAGRKAIMHQVEDSLRRLQTDYIDMLWVHFWDRHTPLIETMSTLNDLVRSGKVRHIGFSDHPAWVCVEAQHIAKANNWEQLIAIQIEYSLLQRTPEDALLPMASHLGLGVTPWSPLRGGVLSGKYTRDSRPSPEETRAAVDSPYLIESTYVLIDEMKAICEELGDEVGATPAQVALNWVQSNNKVSSTIIGAKRLSQLEDNLGALDFVLSDEQRSRLEALCAYTKHFPHNFLDKIAPAIQNGSTVNGLASDPWGLSPTSDDDRH